MMNFTQFLKSAACGVLLAGSLPALADDASITLSVSDITAMDATVTIETNPDDLTYYWNFMDKESFDAIGAENIIENRIERWKKLASSYDNTPWQEMMGYELQEYPMTESINYYFYETLMYDTEYVVYAFGMDREANVTVPVTTAEFKTLTPPSSDNIFEISLKPVEKAGFYLKATAHVEPSNSDRYMVEFFTKEFVDKFNITPGSAAEKRFIADEMLYYLDSDNVASGPHDFQYARCMEGSSYYVIAMGLNEDNTPSTGLTMAEFTAVVEEAPMQGSIELEVSDITPMNAHIRIVPSDENLIYYYGITTPEIIEKKGGVDNIAEKLVIDWWKFLAEIYGGTYAWQDFIPMQTTSGTIDDTVAHLVEEGELEDLYWDSDWVLYAVGFDLEGNVITPTAVLEFNTPAPEKSDIGFEYEIYDVQYNAEISTEKKKYYDVTVYISPSDDEQTFRVNYMQMKYYDQYLEDEEPDMFDFITRQFLPGSVEFEGPVLLKLPQLSAYDYYGDPIEWGVFAMGWNEGPTTDVSLFKFNLDQLSGLRDALGKEVRVKSLRGSLSIEGDYANAAVYSVDGRLAGGIAPGHSLRVAPGVYIVNYTTADGITHSRKVSVR